MTYKMSKYKFKISLNLLEITMDAKGALICQIYFLKPKITYSATG